MSRRQQTLKELLRKLTALTKTVQQLKAGLKADKKPKIPDQELSIPDQEASNTDATIPNDDDDDRINMGPSFIPLLLTSDEFIWANKVFISCIFISRLQFI